MKFVFVAVFLAITFPVNAKTVAEITEEFREMAFQSGDRRSIARYLLEDFAEVAGQLRYCGFRDGQAEVSRLSKEIALWRNPSYWSYWSGDREEDRASIESIAQVHYSVKVLAAKASCDRGPILKVREAMYHRLKREISKMLSKPL